MCGPGDLHSSTQLCVRRSDAGEEMRMCTVGGMRAAGSVQKGIFMGRDVCVHISMMHRRYE